MKESRAGHYAVACPKFADSQRLDPKTSTQLNLASCYELNGQTASAWAAFKEAEAAALKHGRVDWAERAAAAAKELEPRLVRLTVHVPQPLATRQPRIELDGSPLQPTEWERALPVNPGEHRVTWSAPGFKAKTSNVKLVSSSIELTLTELEAEPREEKASAAPATPPPSSFWGTGRVVGAVLGGAGVTSLVVGSVFGLSANAKYGDAEELCGGSGSPRTCRPETSAAALAARDEAGSRATAATIAFVAGGALVASGVVVFALSSPRAPRQLALVPLAGGLAAVGEW